MLTGCGGGESAEREQLGHAHEQLGEQLGERGCIELGSGASSSTILRKSFRS
jgi:hypothetical protein